MQLIILLLSLTVLIWLVRRLFPVLARLIRTQPRLTSSLPRSEQTINVARRVAGPVLPAVLPSTYCEQAQRAYQDMQQLDRDERRRDAPAYRRAAITTYQDVQSLADDEVRRSHRSRKMAAVLQLVTLSHFHLIPRKWLARTERPYTPCDGASTRVARLR